MKLERRFKWDDLESIYKAVEEEEVEKASEGRVRFRAVRADGRAFVGVGYPTTVADMVDTPTGWWKLISNPKGKGNIVGSCSAPNLAKSARASKKASGEE